MVLGRSAGHRSPRTIISDLVQESAQSSGGRTKLAVATCTADQNSSSYPPGVVTSLYTHFHCEFDFLQLHCLSDSTLLFLCFQYTPPACLNFSVPSYNIFHSKGLLLSGLSPLSLLYKISATLILIPLKGFEDDLHIPFHRFSRHQLTRHDNCDSASSPWRRGEPAYQAGPRYLLNGAFRPGRHQQC